MILIFSGCWFFSGYTRTISPKSEPVMRTARQILSYDNTIKTISGIYKIIPDYSTIPAKDSNRAEIRLKDGFGLALETGSMGRRGASEIEQYHNQQVLVTGKILGQCQLETKGYFSTFTSMCIQEISMIKIEK